MNLFELLRGLLPDSVIRQIKQQIDFRFPGTRLKAIRQIAKELHRHAGPPPADCVEVADQAGAPVTEEEINSLKDRIDKAKEQQRKIDADEQERSEREQAEAPLSALELARKRQDEGMKLPQIRTVVMPRMRSGKPKATSQQLTKWWRNGIARDLRRR